MSELINAAYAAIRHAPLRYYAEGGPEVHGPIGNRHSADEWSETYIEAPLNTDRIEFWVRFVCGALFGLFAGLSAAFEFIDSPASLVVAGILGLIVGCGSAAAWHGDKFWRFVLGRWWIWS